MFLSLLEKVRIDHHLSRSKKKFQKIKNLRFERRDRFHWKERKKNSEINMKNAVNNWGEVVFLG